MRSVYVCFTASNSWYGKAIRELTESTVNHSFILFRDTSLSQKWFAIEINGDKGVHITDARRAVSGRKTLEVYEYVEGDLWPGVDKAFSHLGSDYDYPGIVGFLIKLLVWRYLNVGISNPIHREGELFCSEFVMLVLRYCMLDWARCLRPENVSPAFLRGCIRSRVNVSWMKVLVSQPVNGKVSPDILKALTLRLNASY